MTSLDPSNLVLHKDMQKIAALLEKLLEQQNTTNLWLAHIASPPARAASH